MPSEGEQRLFQSTIITVTVIYYFKSLDVVINTVCLAATVGYCTYEYVWPAIRRRFFSKSHIQQKLRLDHPISLNRYEEEIALSGAVSPADIKTTFDDIGGHDQVIDDLMDNLKAMLAGKNELASESSLFLSKLYQPPSGILLYGPPGCGKTLIARALAGEAGARFLNVPLSLLFDKWVGETEKYIEALFSLARKIQPTIIFIDEIDSLTRRRSELDASWNSTMKSQFLSLWDGLLTDRSSQIVLLGATNRRQDIDEAFLRRLSLQIKISLPNVHQRAAILRVLLSDVGLHPDFNFEEIAEATEEFSGSDLREVCRRVVMEASSIHPDRLIDDKSFFPLIDRYWEENLQTKLL